MFKHVCMFIIGLAFVLVVGDTVGADIIQIGLPFSQEPIHVSDSEETLKWDTLNWNDGISSTITGSVDSYTSSRGNTWLKIGFGNPKVSGGWLSFFADGVGVRKAHLEFSPGSVDSNIIDLPTFSDAPLYSFTITTDETPGAGFFDARVFGTTGGVPWSFDLTHNRSIDLSAVDNEVFAYGISNQPTINDPKAILAAEVSLVPEPSTLILIAVGAGFLRRRRR